MSRVQGRRSGLLKSIHVALLKDSKTLRSRRLLSHDGRDPQLRLKLGVRPVAGSESTKLVDRQSGQGRLASCELHSLTSLKMLKIS